MKKRIRHKKSVFFLHTVVITTTMWLSMRVESEKASRTTCAMCILGTNSVLCNVCESESREDFYLLMLTRLNDESDEYFGLQAKCIEMQ